jgi:hypothetical protein
MAAGAYAPGGALAMRWHAGGFFTWGQDPTPALANDDLNGVSCTSSTHCVAVGAEDTWDSLAEHWDGTSWTVKATTPNPGPITDLNAVSCTSSTGCTAVGHYEGDGAAIDTQTHALRWNGTSWTSQAPPNPANFQNKLSGVSCTSSTHCVAVGSQRTSTGQPKTLAMTWNGTTWTTQTTPNPSGSTMAELTGVSCTSSTACTAVGVYQTGTGGDYGFPMRWNGTSWSVQGVSLPPGANFGRLDGVSCATSTACVAVGSYVDLGVGTFTMSQTWDGTSWTVQVPPNPGPSDNRLKGVACTSATACHAVGDYVDGSGVRKVLTIFGS